MAEGAVVASNVLLILLALVACFFGYRILASSVVLFGVLVGLFAGASFGLLFAGPIGMIVGAVAGAILLAILAKVAVRLAAFALGAFVGWALTVGAIGWWALVPALLLGIVGALAYKWVVVAATAVYGAYVAARSAETLAGGDSLAPPLQADIASAWLLGAAALALIGFLVQARDARTRD